MNNPKLSIQKHRTNANLSAAWAFLNCVYYYNEVHKTASATELKRKWSNLISQVAHTNTGTFVDWTSAEHPLLGFYMPIELADRCRCQDALE